MNTSIFHGFTFCVYWEWFWQKPYNHNEHIHFPCLDSLCLLIMVSAKLCNHNDHIHFPCFDHLFILRMFFVKKATCQSSERWENGSRICSFVTSYSVSKINVLCNLCFSVGCSLIWFVVVFCWIYYDWRIWGQFSGPYSLFHPQRPEWHQRNPGPEKRFQSTFSRPGPGP